MKIQKEIFPRLVESVKLIASFKQYPKRIDVERKTNPLNEWQTQHTDIGHYTQQMQNEGNGCREMGQKIGVGMSLSFRFHVSNFKALICYEKWLTTKRCLQIQIVSGVPHSSEFWS